MYKGQRKGISWNPSLGAKYARYGPNSYNTLIKFFDDFAPYANIGAHFGVSPQAVKKWHDRMRSQEIGKGYERGRERQKIRLQNNAHTC